MSILTDKRLSVYQFKLYEMILKLLSEYIAGKEVDESALEVVNGQENPENLI
jgi:hypothetical protein